jgi:phosphatidylglycerophosphate synthase
MRVPRTLVVSGFLVAGIALLAVTVLNTDLRPLERLGWQLGPLLPLVLAPSLAWHLMRTMAWHRCFPASSRPSFARAFRVRLAAEAFSYVTIRGVAGEPLKVVLLRRDVETPVSTAAVAVERAAYLVVTASVVLVASLVSLAAISMSREWTRVFWAMGIGAAGAVAVPLWLVIRQRRSPRRTAGVSLQGAAHRPLRTFLRQSVVQIGQLVRSDRRRLMVLLSLETLAYATMVLEVWVVLWAVDVPVQLAGAVAIETFTRVASMMSSFIPANLGALEASNVAAAAAVQAAGGAAALALARRLRGLVWCAAGFAVYPRTSNGCSGVTNHRHSVDSAKTAVIVEPPDSDVPLSAPLSGLPLAERIRRAAARAGYDHVLVWTPSRRTAWESISGTRHHLATVSAESDRARWNDKLQSVDAETPFTVLAAGIVPAPALLEAAQSVTPTPDHPVVEVPAGSEWPSSGVFRVLRSALNTPDLLAAALEQTAYQSPAIDAVQRGRAMLSVRVRRANDLAPAERLLRGSVIKPTDGMFGRFNRRMSIPLSIALIRSTRLNAHVMSVTLIALGMSAGWLFSRGSYAAGVAAALMSWAASVLDGCDGELARFQYKESAFGCWLDTLGDYTYYLAIFTGITIGAVRQSGWTGYWWMGGAALAGTLLTFALLILLRRRITSGRPERLRTTTKAHFYSTGKRWAWLVAKLSMSATRATMPYGVLAFAILGLLPSLLFLVMVGANIYWVSLALELRNLLTESTQSPPLNRAVVGDPRGIS